MGICEDAKKQALDKVAAAYDPALKDLGIVIHNMEEKGLDPTRFYDAKNDQVINLVGMAKDLADLKLSQEAEIGEKVKNECNDSIEFLQVLMDSVVAKYTAGLSTILPKHMTHIDVGEILGGKPLGGDNSIFNVVREQLFTALGLGENNDLRKFVQDPVANAKSAVNDTLKKWGIPVRL